MKVSIAQLRAIGLSDTEILNLIETSQTDEEAREAREAAEEAAWQEEMAARRREQTRIRVQNHRARNACNNSNAVTALHGSPSPSPPSMVSPITPSLTTPSPPSPPKLSARERATRLAENWQPSDDHLSFARGEGLSESEIAREAAKFRDYWFARAGPNARKVDWAATWRNWIRNRRGNGNVETDRERRKRESLEALDQLGRWATSKGDGRTRETVVQFLPRPGTSGGPGGVSGGSS